MNARALIGQSAMVHCVSKLMEKKFACLLNYYKEVIDHKFSWFRGMINQLGWKNTRRIRKSLACGSLFENFSRVLATSRVVYQPINHKNYCLNTHITSQVIRCFFPP